jgi:hypothetical protein
MSQATTDAPADTGLTHEEYKAWGESGEYRPDLGRYFLPWMKQPPLPTALAASTGVATGEPVTVAEPVVVMEAPVVAVDDKTQVKVPATNNPAKADKNDKVK